MRQQPDAGWQNTRRPSSLTWLLYEVAASTAVQRRLRLPSWWRAVRRQRLQRARAAAPPKHLAHHPHASSSCCCSCSGLRCHHRTLLVLLQVGARGCRHNTVKGACRRALQRWQRSRRPIAASRGLWA